MGNVKANMNEEKCDTVLFVNGSTFENCIIISDEYGILKLKENWGLLRYVKKIVFNTETYHIESFLRLHRKLLNSIYCSLLEFEVVEQPEYSEGTQQYYDRLQNDERASRACYYSLDGILYAKDKYQGGDILIKYPIGRTDEIVNVSLKTEDTISIGKSAFEGASQVKKVILSDNIRTIEDRAFKNCISLEEIESAPLLYIGEDAFENCYSLNKITVDEYYKAVVIDLNHQYYKMKEDGSLYCHFPKTNIRVAFSEIMIETLRELDDQYGWEWDRIFYKEKIFKLVGFGYAGKNIQCAKYRSGNEEVTVIAGHGELLVDEMSDMFCWTYGSLYIGGKITGISLGHEMELGEDKRLYGEYELVQIGDSVKKIGEGVFVGAHIEKLILGDALETIGECAFFDACLNEMIVPDSVKYIGEGFVAGDFSKCDVLSLPSTITKLEVDALFLRSGLIKIILRGEQPPKDLPMWIHAGLGLWIGDYRDLEVPDAWNQYLTHDYFENARQLAKNKQYTNIYLSLEDILEYIDLWEERIFHKDHE